MATFSGWWIAGWAVGFGGAVAGAILLLLIIRLARTIASEAEQIRDAISNAYRNTGALFDLTTTNLALDRLTRELEVLREERLG